MEREIHQVTPAKCKLLNKLFQHHQRQLLQEVGTRATGPQSKFAQELAIMETAAKDEAHGAVNMTYNKQLQFQIHQSNAETEATTWSLADRSGSLTSWRVRFMISPRMNRSRSTRNSQSTSLSLNLGGRQSAFRRSGKPLNSA